MFFFQALCVWEPGCCRYRAPLHSVSQLTRGGYHCWAVLPVLISERGGHDCAGRVGDKPRDNVGKGGGGVAEDGGEWVRAPAWWDTSEVVRGGSEACWEAAIMQLPRQLDSHTQTHTQSHERAAFLQRHEHAATGAHRKVERCREKNTKSHWHDSALIHTCEPSTCSHFTLMHA